MKRLPIDIDRQLACDMSLDFLHNSMVFEFRKRRCGKISAEELMKMMDDNIEYARIYNLPLLNEQLDVYQDDPICRLIYQYMVAKSCHRYAARDVYVTVLAQLCGKSYAETLAACRRLESDGAIVQVPYKRKPRKKERDRFRLAWDLSHYWDTFLSWESLHDPKTEKIAMKIEEAIYLKWRQDIGKIKS